jgi:hypothetical protein
MVRAAFESLKQAVSGFQSFAFGGFPTHSDARRVLDGILDDHLGNYPVKFKEQDLLTLHSGSKSWEPVTANGAAFALRLTRVGLMEVAIGLTRAMSEAEKEIAAQETDHTERGFVPGIAFTEWLKEMRGWAMHNGFRYGPFKWDGSPSRFSEFLFEINKLFPVSRDQIDPQKAIPLKDPVASVEALADRLKTLHRVARKKTA